MIRTDRFKDGKQHIVTMSYDDGPDTDLKLIEIFNKYGIKGTFNLISGSFDNPNNWLQAKDVPTVYAGHEIACHTVTHPHLEFLTPKAQYDELMSCRLSLEKASGQIVRGLAFPFGTWSNDTLKNRPSSVTVTLYDGDVAYDTVRLNAANRWTYHWKDLNAYGNWRVLETNIPRGYVPSYSVSADGTVVTITNSKSLIQTGQLNWPVWVLGGAGVALVTLGGAMMLKKKRENDA